MNDLTQPLLLNSNDGSLNTNLLYCDDMLERVRRFPTGSIDLIYLDPPIFFESLL